MVDSRGNSTTITKEIDEFINDYYDRYSGIYIKSKILLDNALIR